MTSFKKICGMPQPQLKKYVAKTLRSYGYEVVTSSGFVYASGRDVLLTAHLDTVHKEKPCDINVVKESPTRTKYASPQGIGGDDRCGVYIILRLLETTGFRPSILFCEDEEVGGLGSEAFCKTEYLEELKNLKFLVELDRKGSNDAVYYNCDNPDFTAFIEATTGYKEAWGSFSDICNLSPECGVASVNLSCGYYNAHTKDEYVILEEMFDTIDAVQALLINAKTEEQYKYIESQPVWWRDFNDDEVELYICYYQNGQMKDATVIGNNVEACLGVFFTEHADVCANDVLDYYCINY